MASWYPDTNPQRPLRPRFREAAGLLILLLGLGSWALIGFVVYELVTHT